MAPNRTLLPRVALALICLSILGCAIERAKDAASAKVTMVGMPKEAVLQCMGPPANSAEVGATEPE